MFSGIFQPLHLLIILVIVMIIFGAGKLSDIGEGLGKSIKGFKKEMRDEEKQTNIEQKEEKKN